MSPSQVSIDNNERLVRLEEQMKAMAASQAKVEMKVDAVYEAFIQAKGARYIVAALWLGFGGAATAIVIKLLSLVGFRMG